MSPRFFALILMVVLGSHSVHANLELAQQRNCLICHAVDKPLLGPAYQEVARRYKGQSDAFERLVDKVIHGGSGVWGAAAMPPNAVTPAEARQLVQWVLAQGGPESASLSPSSGGKAHSAKEQAYPVAMPPPVPGRASTAVRPQAPTTGLTQDQLLRQGRYLVENVMGCGNCHAARAPDTSVVAGKELSGGRTYDTPAFTVTPGNLTADPETGLGHWSVEDIKRAVSQGVRPNGIPLAPMMPVNFYKALTPDDLQALAVYLRSTVPVKNPIPAPVYKQAMQHETYADATQTYSPAEMANNKLLRGRYLASLSHCLDCHTPTVNGRTDFERDGGKGGKRMGVARVLVPNITSHQSAGLGTWSDVEIRQALTRGLGRDGRTLQYPMPWPYLAGLKEFDLDSLVVWLRSLPARE